MYIGGTDERALHHLAAEVLDNAMDEAVAGHANRIEVTLEEEPGSTGRLSDLGQRPRHSGGRTPPKFPGKSALEVIMTTLHSGGKFSGKAYATSGGLHGVGISAWSMRCPLSPGSRWRGTKSFTPRSFRCGLADHAAAEDRQCPQPAGHHRDLRARSCRNLRCGRPKFKPARLFRLVAVQGLPVCRGGNPLEMRPFARFSEEVPAEGDLPVPRRPGRSPGRTARHARMRDFRVPFTRFAGLSRLNDAGAADGPGRMGNRLAVVVGWRL